MLRMPFASQLSRLRSLRSLGRRGGLFILFVLLLLAWFVGGLLGLSGRNLWILRIALVVLILLGAALVTWYRKRSKGDEPDREKEPDEIDATVEAARERLAASKLVGNATLNRLPMVLFLGPPGSTKTTTILRSGLEPDLLAGEVFQAERIRPTPNVNLWYSHGTIFVEAGGNLLQDSSRWDRVVRHLRPQRLDVVLLGRPQAPRAAVVCYSCEEFLKTGSGEEVPAAARRLRKRLSQVSQGLGIRLPVYVLFTKADRIPYFEDYVRNLSRDEAREVLGATLRLSPSASAGSYADREFKRVNDALHRLFHSLATKRLEVLSRENRPEARGTAYEFPREFLKLCNLAAQFLVELCRPSQLEVSHFLRGFYFCGVRAVIVTDAAPAQDVQPVDDPGPVGATQVFDARRRAVTAVPAEAGPRSRKVPQWVFLERFFRNVLLRDRIARAITEGGFRVKMLRRLLLASATALSLLFAGCFTVSFVGNRRLENRTLTAARALAGVIPSEMSRTSAEVLPRFEALRQQLDRLAGYERGSPPLRLRWGLYKGAALYPLARRIYLERLETLLLSPTRRALLASLQNLPRSPTEGSDYGQGYDLLKAYLMTTIDSTRIDSTFLTPILTNRWAAGGARAPEQIELARRQFAFYAGPLCSGEEHSCAVPTETGTVARARSYLRQFSNAEQVYQRMLSGATEENPPIQFSRRFPDAAPVLVNRYEVPGAFTKSGWRYMQSALANADTFFAAEDWVLGEQAPTTQDRQGLSGELRSRYLSDYIQQWKNYLSAAEIVRPRGLRDAANKLERLSGNQSPLLQMFALAAEHTAVDSLIVGRAFQPVQHVTPPGAERYIVESNQDYMTALLELQGTLEQLAGTRGRPADELVEDTRRSEREAERAARQVAQSFAIEGGAADVGRVVETLMQKPIESVGPLLNALGPSRLVRMAREFCGRYRPLMSRYPFNPNATTEARLDDVTAIFHPSTGELWRFADRALQDLVIRQGTRFAPRAGASVNRDFVEFLNRAAAVSEALWSSGTTDPQIEFTLKLLVPSGFTSMTFNIDGRAGRFTPTFTAQRRFTWIGPEAREVRISGELRGRDETLLAFDGTWALFKLLHRASWQTVGPSRYRLRWSIPLESGTVPVEAELNLRDTEPILRRDYFSGLDCVTRVLR